jgi:CDP-paratose 2-epimerase
MKVLITGGAGFLGSNLARAFVRSGASVIICDNLSRRGAETNLDNLKKEFPFIELYEVEVNDVPSVIVKEKPEIVYHFAAQVAVTKSITSPISDFKINAEGTFHVARTAHEHEIPLIYSSTNKVYGDNVNKVQIKELATRYDFDGALSQKGIHEEFPIDAKKHTPYGCSKLAGEIYVREFGGIVNRCSCMYGEHQFGIMDQGWVSYFIRQQIAGNQVTIYGDGKQVRDLLYIDDVVRLLMAQGLALMKGNESLEGEVFSVGGGYGNTISLLELCEKLGIGPRFAEWRPNDQKVFYADITKATQILGWIPKVSVDEGIKKLYDWTLRNMPLSEQRNVAERKPQQVE